MGQALIKRHFKGSWCGCHGLATSRTQPYLGLSQAGPVQPSPAPSCPRCAQRRPPLSCSESTSSIYMAMSSICAALVAAHVRRAGALPYPPSSYCSCHGSTYTRFAHVSACEAQMVKLCSSTLRRHGSSSRPRVWFFRYGAGTSSPLEANSSRTETRHDDGIFWRSLMSAGGPAMRHILVCDDPKSAASSVANATLSGKRTT